MNIRTQITGFTIKYGSATGVLPKMFLYNGQTQIAQISFIVDTATLPNPSVLQGSVIMSFHEKDFKTILEMVQQVKPLFVTFFDTPSVFASLAADQIIAV